MRHPVLDSLALGLMLPNLVVVQTVVKFGSPVDALSASYLVQSPSVAGSVAYSDDRLFNRDIGFLSCYHVIDPDCDG